MSGRSSPTPDRDLLDDSEFRALYARLREQTARATEDRRGALGNVTPQMVMAAARTVRTGRTVSLANPIETARSADNPTPVHHEMTGGVDREVDDDGLHFATDAFTVHVHGDADSHIDALCHVIYDTHLYNNVPTDVVTPDGAVELSIDIARDGIVGRGVLLDIPRFRDVPWLEPGQSVTYDDLIGCERAENLSVDAGDLLLVRVGHRRRRTDTGRWDVASSRAGLHPLALDFAADRRIGALGCDSNSDTAPSLTTAVEFPVHVLAINAMGLHLLDYLNLDELADLCAERASWSFLCVIAPLRLPTATGSPVNPIAIL